VDGQPVAVVIPTRVGWPHMRRSVDAVLPQVHELGGRLVVADASGLPPPELAADPAVQWLELPGRPGYELRQAAYRAASAPIVAVTEDHCAPAADWLAQLVAEHERRPDAAVVYGTVANGSPEHLIDWALFGVGYLSWAPPEPEKRGNPGHANLAFKSWVFERRPPVGDEVLEFRYVAALREAGYEVVASPLPRVTHFQSAGLPATSTLFFHNGRAIAGLRRQRMAGMDWLRLAAPALIAGYRTLRTMRVARTKPDLEPAIRRSAALIALLHLCHAYGESVGYLGGPGDSATHLH
jgi:Glycosyl transferase family 2